MADKGQGYQMGGHAKPQFHASSISNHGFMFGEIDLNVVVVEKNLIEIGNRLEDGFLRYEKKSPAIDVSVQRQLLPRSCDRPHNFRRKRFSRFYVDADTCKYTPRRHCRDGNIGIVRQ